MFYIVQWELLINKDFESLTRNTHIASFCWRGLYNACLFHPLGETTSPFRPLMTDGLFLHMQIQRPPSHLRPLCVRGGLFNSLRPSDAIWRHRSRTTLAQVMACCLTAPSHYLNQCWLIATKVYWYSSEDNFTTDTPAISCQNYSENYSFKISFKSPRGQWVKEVVIYWDAFVWCFLDVSTDGVWSAPAWVVPKCSTSMTWYGTWCHFLPRDINTRGPLLSYQGRCNKRASKIDVL